MHTWQQAAVWSVLCELAQVHNFYRTPLAEETDCRRAVCISMPLTLQELQGIQSDAMAEDIPIDERK